MSRIVRRALAGAAIVSILAVGTASADRVYGDADTVQAGQQGSRDLGTVAPGASLAVSLGFELRCGPTGTSHVDVGQSVTVNYGGGALPADGSASAEPATIGPVPSSWPDDGESCSGQAPLVGTTTATLVAPNAAGSYGYDLSFSASLSPAGQGDATAISSMIFASFTLTVIANTPPVLNLPADVTVEATDPAGAVVTFEATATDAEDDPDPAVVCDPASGSLFPVGTTTVTCTATDTTGATASGSFAVAVTPPPAPPPPPPAPAPSLTVSFDPPVGPDSVLHVTGERVVPVKARVTGATDSSVASLALAVSGCEESASAPVLVIPMTWQPGSARWMGLLPTAALPAGCFDVSAVAGTGNGYAMAADPTVAAASGGFTLWVDPPPARGPKAR